MSKPGRRANRQNRNRKRFEPYRNRQPSRALSVMIGIPMLVCLLAAMGRPDHSLSLWLLSCVFLVIFMLFSSMTTEVTQDQLAWRFGPGLVHKEVALERIVSARIIRARLTDGLGIHYTRNGWYYSVSGRDAVAIVLDDGRSFALGTNDPVGLWSAIEQHLAPPVAEESTAEPA